MILLGDKPTETIAVACQGWSETNFTRMQQANDHASSCELVFF